MYYSRTLKILYFSILATLINCASPWPASTATHVNSNRIEQGIDKFQRGNYQEALSLFLNAQAENPNSSLVAYHLGLTYKQIRDYDNAITHLRAAVENIPKVKNALIALIECYYLIEDYAQAKEWISLAEREGIRPAQIAYYKGLIAIQEQDRASAIQLFQQAQEFDQNLAPDCHYQLGWLYLQNSQLPEAKKSFTEVSQSHPDSQLAKYARENLKIISRLEETNKPWHFLFRSTWEYDDNVVLKPGNSPLATDISDKSDWRIVYEMQVEYQSKIREAWGIKGRYDFYYSKQNELGYYNTMSHEITFEPVYYLKKSQFSMPIKYNHIRIDDRSYLSQNSVGTLYEINLTNRHIGSLSLEYNDKDYLWTPSSPDEDRDANEMTSELGGYWLFADQQGYIRLSYLFDQNMAEGNNWEYQGHMIITTLLIPLSQKMDLSLGGYIFFQDYANPHSTFGVEREDNIYTGYCFLTYEFEPGCEFQVQYTYVRDDANIDFYDYTRQIYSVGIQIHF